MVKQWIVKQQNYINKFLNTFMNKLSESYLFFCLANYVLDLKELEHRKLGWKVLTLKYDLGKSLRKEMWYKMADTKIFLDYIF